MALNIRGSTSGGFKRPSTSPSSPPNPTRPNPSQQPTQSPYSGGSNPTSTSPLNIKTPLSTGQSIIGNAGGTARTIQSSRSPQLRERIITQTFQPTAPASPQSQPILPNVPKSTATQIGISPSDKTIRLHKGAAIALFNSANIQKSKIPSMIEYEGAYIASSPKQKQIKQFNYIPQGIQDKDAGFIDKAKETINIYSNRAGYRFEQWDQRINPYTQPIGKATKNIGKFIESKLPRLNTIPPTITNESDISKAYRSKTQFNIAKSLMETGEKVIPATPKFIAGTITESGRMISQNPVTTIALPFAAGAIIGGAGALAAGTVIEVPLMISGTALGGVSYGYGMYKSEDKTKYVQRSAVPLLSGLGGGILGNKFVGDAKLAYQAKTSPNYVKTSNLVKGTGKNEIMTSIVETKGGKIELVPDVTKPISRTNYIKEMRAQEGQTIRGIHVTTDELNQLKKQGYLITAEDKSVGNTFRMQNELNSLYVSASENPDIANAYLGYAGVKGSQSEAPTQYSFSLKQPRPKALIISDTAKNPPSNIKGTIQFRDYIRQQSGGQYPAVENLIGTSIENQRVIPSKSTLGPGTKIVLDNPTGSNQWTVYEQRNVMTRLTEKIPLIGEKIAGFTTTKTRIEFIQAHTEALPLTEFKGPTYKPTGQTGFNINNKVISPLKVAQPSIGMIIKPQLEKKRGGLIQLKPFSESEEMGIVPYTPKVSQSLIKSNNAIIPISNTKNLITPISTSKPVSRISFASSPLKSSPWSSGISKPSSPSKSSSPLSSSPLSSSPSPSSSISNIYSSKKSSRVSSPISSSALSYYNSSLISIQTIPPPNIVFPMSAPGMGGFAPKSGRKGWKNFEGVRTNSLYAMLTGYKSSGERSLERTGLGARGFSNEKSGKGSGHKKGKKKNRLSMITQSRSGKKIGKGLVYKSSLWG